MRREKTLNRRAAGPMGPLWQRLTGTPNAGPEAPDREAWDPLRREGRITRSPRRWL